MSFSITVDVLCPKIVAKFYVHPLDFSHGILRERGLGGEGDLSENFIAKSLLAPGAFQFSSGFSSGDLRVSMLYITCMTNIGTRCK